MCVCAEVRDPDGQQIRGDLCPVSGRFHFVYNVNDGSESNMECPVKSVSRLDTCPSGAVMALRFRGCSFEDHSKYPDHRTHTLSKSQ